jgi:hypothetical protein
MKKIVCFIQVYKKRRDAFCHPLSLHSTMWTLLTIKMTAIFYLFIILYFPSSSYSFYLFYFVWMWCIFATLLFYFVYISFLLASRSWLFLLWLAIINILPARTYNTLQQPTAVSLLSRSYFYIMIYNLMLISHSKKLLSPF